MVRRRVAGEPLEQVLGWVRFGGLRLVVRPGVFVPRRRTELLATEAVARARPGSVVVDLCCGIGAVAAVLLANVPDVEVYAADIDPVEVGCACVNLPGATVLEGDLYDALPARLRGRVDLLVANAPYVPTDRIATMPPEAREHEPLVALDGGPDGLDVVRRIVAEALPWLAGTGGLLFECGADQVETVRAFVGERGLAARMVTDDETGGTVVVADRSSR
jgi:release factor glutamine methyltransferase